MMTSVLDRERWRHVDAPFRTQKLVRCITDLSLGSIDEALHGDAAEMRRVKGSKQLEVSGMSFKVVGACITFVSLLADYLDCAQQFPSLSNEVRERLFFLLRRFNSRVKHLVLNAGARKTAANMQLIAAKHLALASQSIGMGIALLPAIRTCLASWLPPKHHAMLNELDRIKSDYTEHREAIFDKFVDIILTRVVNPALLPEEKLQAAELKRPESVPQSLADIAWDDASTDDAEPTPNMVYVTRNIKSLHKSLHGLLPASELQDIFTRIFALINTKLPSMYSVAMPKTDDGVRRVCNDIRHALRCLKALEGLRGPGNTLQLNFHTRFGDISNSYFN
jgi:vacuolar protein sorting-associated protein 54